MACLIEKDKRQSSARKRCVSDLGRWDDRCSHGEMRQYESDAHKREHPGSDKYGCQGTNKPRDLNVWRMNCGFKEESKGCGWHISGGHEEDSDVYVRYGYEGENKYDDLRRWHRDRGYADESMGRNQKGLHKSCERRRRTRGM